MLRLPMLRAQVIPLTADTYCASALIHQFWNLQILLSLMCRIKGALQQLSNFEQVHKNNENRRSPYNDNILCLQLHQIGYCCKCYLYVRMNSELPNTWEGTYPMTSLSKMGIMNDEILPLDCYQSLLEYCTLHVKALFPPHFAPFDIPYFLRFVI